MNTATDAPMGVHGTPRQRWLGAALALSLGATAAVAWWAPDEDEPVVVPAAPSRRAAPPVATAAPTATALTAAGQAGFPQTAALPATAEPPAASPRRDPWPTAPADSLLAWGVPTPPPAAEPPPVQGPPPAPQFPYTWIGRLDDASGGSTVLLGGAQRSLGARVGDVLDGQWRVDRITRSALHLTWLPTGQATQLSSR